MSARKDGHFVTSFPVFRRDQNARYRERETNEALSPLLSSSLLMIDDFDRALITVFCRGNGSRAPTLFVVAAEMRHKVTVSVFRLRFKGDS